MRQRIALASTGLLAIGLLVSLLVLQFVQPASATGGVAAVEAGGGHSCALTTTGGVKCWGANGSGQLGNGAEEDQPLPVDVYTCEDLPDAVAGGLPPECIPLTGVDAVTTGFAHTCALHESGTALCWGRNQYGQLGDATTVDRTAAILVCVGTAGAAGGATSCCPVTPNPTPSATVTGTAPPAATATATATRTPTPTVTPSPGPCGALAGVVEISAGASHTCALSDDSSVWCWGENGFGQLGDGTTLDSSVPVHVCGSAPAGVGGSPSCPTFTGVAAVHAGSFHTCALMEDGGAACWGNNSSGQLGDGTLDDSALPVHVCEVDPNAAGAPCAVLSSASAITAGGSHSCALVEDGALLCWGENSSGQLGDGTSFDRPAPVAPCHDVPTPTPTATLTATPTATPSAAGSSACCSFVLGESPAGAVVCSLLGVVGVSAGGEHTCAILEEGGGILCWGSNISGQLGDGTTFDSPLPIVVCSDQPLTAGVSPQCGALSDAAVVSAGYLHTCALMEDGGALCWGANSEGKLGDGTHGDRSKPAEVEGFAGKPTVTPTRTVTFTATPGTGTATGTPTPVATNTPTGTPTAPGANTPTHTSTPSTGATNTPTRTPTPPSALNGDVNCDGEITAVDAALILQLVAALIDSVGCPNNVDVNGDGSIDPIDAALILQYTAGLILSL